MKHGINPDFCYVKAGEIGNKNEPFGIQPLLTNRRHYKIEHTMKSIHLSFLILAVAISGLRAEPYRTDINPALLYYLSFIVGAEMPQADHDYLLTNEWRGQQLPARFGGLVDQSDNRFNFVREAAHATVPCDWGIDWSAGPYTLLPHLARVKATAQMARLRAMWDLQNGRPANARDDLIATFVMGRNGSRDNSLIAVLVQIAVENIVVSTVAENFGRFSPETLKQLVDGFDAAPARGTVATSIATTEMHLFADWAEAKALELRKQYPDDDARVLDGFRDVFEDLRDNSQEGTNVWLSIVKASGGTSAGFLRLVGELKPLDLRLATISALPPAEFDVQEKQFYADIDKSTNPLVRELFPAVRPARSKEFAILTELAMLRAAVEYRLHGEAGLKSVMDPCGNGPFEFQRFIFNGEDRGFELKSACSGRGFPEVMIFVEKDGPPFYVNGKNAGKAVSP
jgi:hypothetical protein